MSRRGCKRRPAAAKAKVDESEGGSDGHTERTGRRGHEPSGPAGLRRYVTGPLPHAHPRLDRRPVRGDPASDVPHAGPSERPVVAACHGAAHRGDRRHPDARCVLLHAGRPAVLRPALARTAPDVRPAPGGGRAPAARGPGRSRLARLRHPAPALRSSDGRRQAQRRTADADDAGDRHDLDSALADVRAAPLRHLPVHPVGLAFGPAQGDVGDRRRCPAAAAAADGPLGEPPRVLCVGRRAGGFDVRRGLARAEPSGSRPRGR